MGRDESDNELNQKELSTSHCDIVRVISAHIQDTIRTKKPTNPGLPFHQLYADKSSEKNIFYEEVGCFIYENLDQLIFCT